MKIKKGLFINGYNLEESNWEYVVWGKEPLLGRLPRSALMIKYHNPEIIVFGSGSSTRDGVKEAVWMKNTLFSRFYELRNFSIFQGIHLTSKIREKIEGAITETESKNTEEETRNAMNIFLEHGIQEVIIVSSPDHFMRAARDALIAAGSKIKILATHSDTPYGGSVEDVIIVEPRHEFHYLIKKIMELSSIKNKNIIERLETILNF